MNLTNDLALLFNRVDSLRKEGVKMKNIAEYLGISPSVLSSLYSTVLPRYSKEIQSKSSEESLDIALSFVNNVSKKTLLSTLPSILEALDKFSTSKGTQTPDNPLFTALQEEIRLSEFKMAPYFGSYLSYSLSSSSEKLKIEPMVIFSTQQKDGVRVCRHSAYGELQWGIGFMGDVQNMYIMINERDIPPITPVSYYFHLPLYKNPRLIRGQYIGLDYNYVPVSRRVVLVKQSESISLEELQQLRCGIFSKEELSEEEKHYFQYTCCKGDIIKMCTIPSVQMNETDLIKEKIILDL